MNKSNGADSPPPSNPKMLERVQPASVQVPCGTTATERENIESTEAGAAVPERAIITLSIEIEALACAAADLEKVLSRPGRSLWLRHYLGEAIRYVVGKSQGRQWSYLVKSGRISWRAQQ